MFVMIIGGGRTGTQLALMLLEQNHKVHLIENRREVLSRVHRELPTEVIYEGNPFDPEILEMAGIKEAQVLAAVTTSDELNLALCYFSRETYGVQRTIARVNNPRNAWLFDQTFHVDVAVNQTELMSTLIEEEMSMGDMMTLMKLRRGHLALVEERIGDGARAIGVAIKDLGLPDHCVIAAIIRNGEVIVPRGVSKLEAGDDVMAVTDPGAEEVLAELFSTPQSRKE
jgi:trk system potassium uptake protein